MRAALVALCLAATALATGCQTLTEQEAKTVAERRENAVKLVDSFAAALRGKTPEAIGELLHPQMPPAQRVRLTTMIEGAARSIAYSGYVANSRDAVSDISPRGWLKSRVDIDIPGTNSYGDPLSEPMTLIAGPETWYIGDLELAVPVEGTELDLNTDEVAAMAKVTSELFDLMRRGKGGHIGIQLPDGDFNQFHTETPGFFARLFGTEIYRVSVIGEIKAFERLTIRRWPDPVKDMTPVYDGKGRVRAVYEIPCSWPDGNIMNDVVELDIYLAKTDDGYKLETMRFYGQAFYKR